MPADLSAFWHPDTLAYRPPDGAYYAPSNDLLAVDEPHPDSPDRVRNIKHAVEQALDEHTTWTESTPGTRTQIRRVHEPAYVETVRAAANRGGERVIPSTWVDEATYDAALAATGLAVDAVDAAVDGSAPVAYALCRPSGHHAQPAQLDGFCVFNNAAVAVAELLSTGRADRVAIVDWDVHHGNGTQEIFYDRDDVLVVDVHNDHGAWHTESHPQTGSVEEVGEGAGSGYTVNLPVPPGTGDEGYAWLFDHVVEPVVESFDPDVLVCCAGQDPGQLDPQGRNLVTTAGFYDIGRRARRLADAHAEGSLAIVQEGGYQLSHLGLSTLSVLEGALGTEPTLPTDPLAWLPEAFETLRPQLEAVADAHADRWPIRD